MKLGRNLPPVGGIAFATIIALGVILTLPGCAPDPERVSDQEAIAAAVESTAPQRDLGSLEPSPPAAVPQGTATNVVTDADGPVAPADAAAAMPNLLCMDLQAAQDLMQEITGNFFAIESYDASGSGRAMLWDRNWTVVAQSPEDGSTIGDALTIGAVKDDEAQCDSGTPSNIVQPPPASEVIPPQQSTTLRCAAGGSEMAADATCVDPWPFTVPQVILVCRDEGFATGVKIDGTTYAINGYGSSHRERLGWEDIDDHRYLWQDDGDFGLKISIGDAIAVASSICG